MNKEQQRIAIAEACGWSMNKGPNTWTSPSGELEFNTPDYLNDLNAMHEAEKALTYLQLDSYVTLLFDNAKEHAHSISPTTNAIEEPWGQFATRATASQRAEAFLRTIGKWKD